MGNTLKRIISLILTGILLLCVIAGSVVEEEATHHVIDTEELEVYMILHPETIESEEDEIRTEIMYGEIELLAQLVQAEAGNQDELGKRYVADCVLNRVGDPDFPERLEDVIFQQHPIQFSCTVDGNFDKAGWNISDESFKVAFEEYTGERANTEIIYFRTDGYSTSGTPAFQHGDHYFSTK